MLELHLVLELAAIVIPLIGALALWRLSRPRSVAAAATVFSLICLAAALWLAPKNSSGPLMIDSLSAAPIVVTTTLALVVFAGAPARDLSRRFCLTLLFILSGTLLIYMAGRASLLLAGWLLTAVPFFVPGANRNESRGPHTRLSIVQGLSTLLFAASVLLIGDLDLHSASANTDSTSLLAFALATAAALIRAGVFPFHSWLVSEFDGENLLVTSALVSTQVGAFLVARLTVLLPAQAQIGLPFLSDLALFSSLILAFLSIGESKPARLLALTAASQSGFVIAGLENRSVEGITGALVHWLVISSAIVGLSIVLRGLQARVGDVVNDPFAGLASRAPRSAVFFIICALALVGLPGTLGFPADDLLFHGSLEAHPALGLALPIATALTAIALFRCFAHLFLGKRRVHVVPISDVLNRERFALTLVALFLVLGGLLPSWFVNSRIGAAHVIASALAGDHVVPPLEADSHASR